MKTQGLLIALISLAVGAGLGLALRPGPQVEEVIITEEKTIEKEVVVSAGQLPRLDQAPVIPPPSEEFANLSSAPDWNRLNQYSYTLTQAEFIDQIERVYSVKGNWKPWLNIGPEAVRITTSGQKSITIPFATSADAKRTAPKYWNTSKPLDQLNITIDPGHIGGDFAKVEERFFQIGDRLPAMEGSMTRIVAHKLAAQLRAAGARVSLTRTNDCPVTTTRPDDLTNYVRDKYGPDQSEAAVSRRQELFFYRTAEIRSRADLINTVYQPDLVICLHFNASPWGSPDSPLLLNDQHLHILNNGAYTDTEWAQEDQRFELLERVFQNIHESELSISQDVIRSFQKHTDLPPYKYQPDSSRANQLDNSYYIWARNLLASRIFTCPVIYMEPYVMNSRDTYQRIQDGDYPGLREGRLSLYNEYATAVAEGIITHFQK